MKRGLNRVILMGNVGRDPEVKYLQNGQTLTTFSMATPDSRKVDGEEKDLTEWHTVVFFGRLAEIAGEYLVKGSEVTVEGRLKTDKWEDKDGNKKQLTKIVGSNLIMVGSKKKKEERESGMEHDVPF